MRSERSENRAIQLVNFLLDAKADLNVPGKSVAHSTAQYPVIQAAKSRMWRVLAVLVSRGARVDCESRDRGRGL